jgi:hypothetical protein
MGVKLGAEQIRSGAEENRHKSEEIMGEWKSFVICWIHRVFVIK